MEFNDLKEGRRELVVMRIECGSVCVMDDKLEGLSGFFRFGMLFGFNLGCNKVFYSVSFFETVLVRGFPCSSSCAR